MSRDEKSEVGTNASTEAFLDPPVLFEQLKKFYFQPFQKRKIIIDTSFASIPKVESIV